MTDALMRMQELHRNVADASAEMDALAARMPEPVDSVYHALQSLSTDQRNRLWNNRTEAMRLLDELATELQLKADQLTTDWKARLDELNSLQLDGPIHHIERIEQLVPWLSARQEELQQLQVELSELSALYTAFRSNPLAPPRP